MKQWQIKERKSENLIEHLLISKGFNAGDLTPPHPHTFLEKDSSLLNLFPDLEKTVSFIEAAIADNLPIIIHGDYDADGICATAILWEAIYYGLGYKNVIPFIPNRFEHGYGLSEESLACILAEERDAINRVSTKNALIITVDCGITSIKEVKKAKELGFKIIITDHHQKCEELPEADAILWTDKLVGAGIAWVLSHSICRDVALLRLYEEGDRLQGLDLAALATIADIQPLTEYNRSIVKYGLEEINNSKRVGLQELLKVGGVYGKQIKPWEVGWVLAPRINASGRLEDALCALRLLVTKSHSQALEISEKLDLINKERQEMTKAMVEEAKKAIGSWPLAVGTGTQKVILVSSANFHEGIIGLVAGRLAQEFYRPAIAISECGDVCKGSARSIPGVSIIELLREFEYLFEGLGGHMGAAGFSIRREKISDFRSQLLDFSNKTISADLLVKKLDIDAQISLDEITSSLWNFLESLEPYGIGNSRPKFITKGVTVVDYKFLGNNGNHLKLLLKVENKSNNTFPALWFSFPPDFKYALKIGATFDIVYSIDENRYNGRREIQLLIEDARATEVTSTI